MVAASGGVSDNLAARRAPGHNQGLGPLTHAATSGAFATCGEAFLVSSKYGAPVWLKSGAQVFT